MKKITYAGLKFIFSLIGKTFVQKEEYNQKISTLEKDIQDAEKAMSEALNGVDVSTQELIDAGMAEIEYTLAAAWDDLDRRINS